ncbi:MAG: c-type cytochrome [Planctomycetota bacterium]
MSRRLGWITSWINIFLLVGFLGLWPDRGGWCQESGDADATTQINTVADLLLLIIDADEATARDCLNQLADKIQNNELDERSRRALSDRLREKLGPRLPRPGAARDPLANEAITLAVLLREPAGVEPARALASDGKQPAEVRQRVLAALLLTGDKKAHELAEAMLTQGDRYDGAARALALQALTRSTSPLVAPLVIRSYARLEGPLQPKAIELLTQRPASSKALLEAIGRGEIATSALNANHVAKLMASRDPELRQLVVAKWGTVRQERNPQRQQVIDDVRQRLERETGEPVAGQKIFQRLCAQCHKIHGEGQEVGPDITANGRANVEQLLSNVLDPSLVIGASYQARIVVTSDGRVLTGLVVEDSPQRVSLKVPGGKLETIARADVEELRVSELSLMPEGLEKQLTATELLDLFAFLTLDKPPSDPTARRIPPR